MVEHGRRIGLARGEGRLVGRLDRRGDLGLDRVQLLRGGRPVVGQEGPQRQDRVAGLPLLDFLPGPVPRVAHPLGVRPLPVGPALQQGGPAAGPCPRDRPAGFAVDFAHVVAVDHGVRQRVGFRLLRDALLPGHGRERHLGGVQVVLAHEQHGQLPDRRHVAPLVEGAVVDRAVAEVGHAHPVAAGQLEGVGGAGRQQDARPDDAAGAHQPDLRLEQVHAAAASAGGAAGQAVQLGEQLDRGQPLGQRVAVAAVGAEHQVVVAQVGADAGGDRLLADVGVAAAVDQSGLERPDQPLLALPDRDHGPVAAEQQIPVRLPARRALPLRRRL